MPDPEAVRRLLEGDIDPSEIEDDVALYSMAERIYGSEALEEMGVQAPQIVSIQETKDLGSITDDISLPDFIPNLSEMKEMFGKSRRRRRWLVFLTGISGIIGTIFNMTIGIGTVLCSVGVANMRQICNDDYGQTKVVWTEGYTYDHLHDIEAWVKPMTEPLIGDLTLITIFAFVAIFGILSKKK